MNARILLATALIMFSGSGGLSDGFERAGFETTGLDFTRASAGRRRRRSTLSSMSGTTSAAGRSLPTSS